MNRTHVKDFDAATHEFNCSAKDKMDTVLDWNEKECVRVSITHSKPNRSYLLCVIPVDNRNDGLVIANIYDGRQKNVHLELTKRFSKKTFDGLTKKHAETINEVVASLT